MLHYLSPSPVTLDDWLARIEQLHPEEIELGLDRLRVVAERLSLLGFSCPVITVSGTNGKGSTVQLMERLARAAGYSTALYTSPHILRFNERVRINGEPADDESLCAAFTAVEAARGEVALTYFEFSTLAAWWLFQSRSPDLLIQEVGLGGRLDAVNLMDADVSVITSVGLDHQDWLGDSREQIAREKAGILRSGRPLLYGEENMPSTVALCAEEGGARLLRAGEVFGVQGNTLYWQQDGARRSLELNGEIPLGSDNLASAVQALALVGRLPEAEIAAVAMATSLPGRCQHIIRRGAHWYLDVGHNREALRRFHDRLPVAPGRRLLLCAMLADKPAEALAVFMPSVDHWYFAGLGGHRGRSAAQLRSALSPPPLPSRCSEYQNVVAAVDAMLEEVQEGDQVIVCGSFHTVAEAMSVLGLTLE